MAVEAEHQNPSGFFIEVTFPAHTYAHASDKHLKILYFAGKTFLIKLSNSPFILWLLNTFRKRQSLQLANGNKEVYSSYIKSWVM